VNPGRFDYERAESIAEAIALLEQHRGAKLLAGGQSLLPLMRLRLVRPRVLVDISQVKELRYIRDDGEEVAIGAGARHCDLAASDVLRAHVPMLAYAAGTVGDPQVRHAGTIGGAVSHADPASDEAAVLVALGARYVTAEPAGGNREIAASSFAKGSYATEVAPGEIVTEIRVPKPASDSGWSYQRFSRRAQDFAVVGVAVVVEQVNGGIKGAVAMAGMGVAPLRAHGVEEALASGADIPSAAAESARGAEPPTDAFASADYRRRLAGVLTRRALEDAMRMTRRKMDPKARRLPSAGR
jgi:carbon-monoxide dehydrogenase medium subunit